jgi:hypothetical protein
MTALEDIQNRVDKALERAKRRDKTIVFQDISVKQTKDPADYSLRFLVTHDSGFIDEEVRSGCGHRLL